MNRAIAIAAAIVIGGATASVSWAAVTGDETSAPKESTAPALDDTWVSSAERTDELNGFSLAPADGQPKVDSEQASKIAWSEEAAPTTPDSTQAVLTDMSWERFGINDQAVWVISYADVCQPLYGGLTSSGKSLEDRPECTKVTFNSVVDATSGEWLIAFARPQAVFAPKDLARE